MPINDFDLDVQVNSYGEERRFVTPTTTAPSCTCPTPPPTTAPGCTVKTP